MAVPTAAVDVDCPVQRAGEELLDVRKEGLNVAPTVIGVRVRVFKEDPL